MKKTIHTTKPKPLQSGTIRIIGGQYRGKKITFPTMEGLRPTPDRIRETLFNWLMHDIRHAHCLDVFAGSGALGFEAYSRGADRVVFLEKTPTTYQHLKHIAGSFNSQQLQVIQTCALDYLSHHRTSHEQPYDIIFIDPPFAQPELYDCIQALEDSPLLNPKGLLYVESSNELTLNPQRWHTFKIKKAGLVTYALYQKIDEPSGK